MWKVLFVLTVLTASGESYSKKSQTAPSRNQRIIKVQGPPHFNHFHGHQKPIRKRPYGVHHDEFIRPNHPPPIPPFFNGPSTNHIKHLPRPPPHVFHKSPSYGLGFPYKSITNYRPIKIPKDKFRVQSLPVLPVRTTSSSSSSGSSSSGASVTTSSTYHSPTFTSSSSYVSSPVPHIISSDDNNGPIREIPAPNLAPKPHEASFGSIGILNDVHGGVSDLGVVGGVGGVGVSGLGVVGGIESVSTIGSIGGVSGLGSVKIHGGDVGSISGILHGVGDIGGGGAVHGDLSGAGGIHGVSGAVALHSVSGGGGIHGVSDAGSAPDISNLASVGGVTHLEPGALLHSVAKNPNAVNLDAIVKDQGLQVNTYIKESVSDGHHGKEHTVEIANFDEGSSLDVTNLIKDAAETSDHSEHHSGYEVTEHHNHLPSNDQIIKGHDGTKLYYAPDPDPSLPVHKVPPTNDPHSTPSNGQNINNMYLPQVSHGYPYIQGGSVGGHLSSQELFHLMHGYPAVISQPIVAFVGQPQTAGVILPGGGHNYFQQNSASYGSDQYSHDEHGGNDIRQYLQQPEIHNLIHHSPETHQEQESIGGSHSSVVSQAVYSPQNQYQSYIQTQHQDSVTNSASSLKTSNGNFPTSEINHNYQYEPEASESDNRNGLTVIRQASEGTLNSETVKELLLEDSEANEFNKRGKSDASQSVPTILHLKNIPEVPFYASLPSQKAAEALATLQAAGSVASNYMNKIKITRGDQGAEEEQEETVGRSKSLENDNTGGDEYLKSQAVQLGSEKTLVEIQKSVPLYETSISAKNLIDIDEDRESDLEFSSEGQNDSGNLDFKEDESNETFGKRLRPK